ncbi:hypothetical protein [Escherichia sp. B1147]|uniref:hypothetical protein n=1 Tax=Escherichia sp. B1147 TaxID=754307 RepID=UPI000A5ADC87|nr:hypothetical protein [Escherichia sp. B1147]
MIIVRAAMILLFLANTIVTAPATAAELTYGKQNNEGDPGFFQGLLRPFNRTGAVIAPTTSTTPIYTGLERSGGTYNSGGGVYCYFAKPSNRTNVIHNLVPATGKVFDGAQLFKTSRQGLYFSVKVINLSVPEAVYSPADFYLIDGILKINANGENCLQDRNTRNLQLDISVRYYIDNTFSPTPDNNGEYMSDFEVSWLLQPIGYDRTSNGPAIVFESSTGLGVYLALQLSTTSFYVSGPTCYSTVLVQNEYTDLNNNVWLGTYTTTEVKNNTTRQVPFQVQLNNCLSVKNIKVKLKSSDVSLNDVTLLGNSYGSASGAAQGAAVAVYAKSPSNTIIKLNANSSNTYIESETDVWSSDFINLDDITSGTSQTMNFLAQVVRDGQGATVTGGQLLSKGTLVFTYE